MVDAPNPNELNRYGRIIEHIFFQHYTEGATEITFDRDEMVAAAEALGIRLPKNLGDVLYSFRYRGQLPASVRDKAPPDRQWIIRPAGRARYKFVPTRLSSILPAVGLAETKVPDATPGIIVKYANDDEQALLARLRYNRLIDIFTGVACYSLQSHLRTTVDGSQVETDEIYVGVDRRGVHYVFPVQAKGGVDVLSVVQIEQDLAVCRNKFQQLICRPIAAQFMANDVIALFEFEEDREGVAIAAEKHYKLVAADQVTAADLATYQIRP